jgi:hypothetical protein
MKSKVRMKKQYNRMPPPKKKKKKKLLKVFVSQPTNSQLQLGGKH